MTSEVFGDKQGTLSKASCPSPAPALLASKSSLKAPRYSRSTLVYTTTCSPEPWGLWPMPLVGALPTRRESTQPHEDTEH